MNETKRMAGRRVLITGAASGIGKASAQCLAGHGAALALLDRDGDALAQVAGELGAHAETLDLMDERAIVRAVAASGAAMGGIDAVVNVAGIGEVAPLGETTLESWNRVVAINLTAPFLVCREALPLLRASEDGAIVNISSGQGLLPSVPGMGSYCASKGGLVTWTKAMALELAPIRVNAICPGVVDTPLLPDGMREAARSATSPYALRRVGDADEIAQAVLYLASAQSSFVTGVALAVDGGRSYH
ncbi:SDR family NAD(P)-dependent oxidoreductase [Croceicoccus mobilis]|uniref:3-oxoacyl-ACP reductase n=1 Tax=Croceicoccus mobilis TaxID=1703339 RepID=A0A916Z7H4_9SPHN|nr:SDR family NAD(P)-dependent oxidoreductase [Croceicoccus mobilis]GGD80002.1 3-oxoacyl-ACP reductase [Croceicoccus mobilis]